LSCGRGGEIALDITTASHVALDSYLLQTMCLAATVESFREYSSVHGRQYEYGYLQQMLRAPNSKSMRTLATTKEIKNKLIDENVQ
jgi:hypothetical protein